MRDSYSVPTLNKNINLAMSKKISIVLKQIANDTMVPKKFEVACDHNTHQMIVSRARTNSAAYGTDY